MDIVIRSSLYEFIMENTDISHRNAIVDEVCAGVAAAYLPKSGN
jgi:hypothetical protein